MIAFARILTVVPAGSEATSVDTHIGVQKRAVAGAWVAGKSEELGLKNGGRAVSMGIEFDG